MASSSPSLAIAALLPLVDAFNRRHRNQHRTSHWWRPFSILRRALGVLADGLADGLLPPGPDPSPSARRRRRRRHHVVARARWLRSHVAPRAYVAFTQLAADNQHAPLGLMLLALLARAYAALADLGPPDAPDAPDPPDVQLSPPPCHSSPKAQPSPPSPAEPPGPDRGVVVSRREALAAHASLASTDSQTLAPHHPPKHSRHGDKHNKRHRKKTATNNEPDALSSLFSSLD